MGTYHDKDADVLELRSSCLLAAWHRRHRQGKAFPSEPHTQCKAVRTVRATGGLLAILSDLSSIGHPVRSTGVESPPQTDDTAQCTPSSCQPGVSPGQCVRTWLPVAPDERADAIRAHQCGRLEIECPPPLRVN